MFGDLPAIDPRTVHTLRTTQRLHSAHSVVSWAVLFIKPRYRVFV